MTSSGAFAACGKQAGLETVAAGDVGTLASRPAAKVGGGAFDHQLAVDHRRGDGGIAEPVTGAESCWAVRARSALAGVGTGAGDAD